MRSHRPDAPSHALTTTYRSGGRIVYVAGRLISHLHGHGHAGRAERTPLRAARKKGHRVVSAVVTVEIE